MITSVKLRDVVDAVDAALRYANIVGPLLQKQILDLDASNNHEEADRKRRYLQAVYRDIARWGELKVRLVLIEEEPRDLDSIIHRLLANFTKEEIAQIAEMTPKGAE